MGQAREKSRAVLIVEDDAEVRSLAATLLEDKQLNVIECESAEAALAIMLIGGRDVAMIFAEVRLRRTGASGSTLTFSDRISNGTDKSRKWP
jgi:DNA-binding NtrC family response regulator